MAEAYLGRWVFTHEGLAPGCLRVDGDRVLQLQLGRPPGESTRSVILPGLVNSHTHIGDSFAHPAPSGSVEETVGPGGFKERALASATSEAKRSGMRSSLETMLRTGTTRFVDFREEGLRGISDLEAASEGIGVKGVALGRPTRPDSDEDELNALLDRCDGLAFSSVSDWPVRLLEEASRVCKRRGKTFALHASEAKREDIEAVLGLEPDFLVHMTSAEDRDLVRCSEDGVPVVVCPTSNRAFGLVPDIPRLLALGMIVALGTDNAMICRPDMLSEIRAAFALEGRAGRLSAEDAVRLATYSGHKVLYPKGKITTELSTSDDLVLIDVQGEDPLLELVSSGGASEVSAVIQNGLIRRKGVWTA